MSTEQTPEIVRGDARKLDMIPDASIDLIVTSPPYYGLRSYTDGGEHYAGQIGDEDDPRAYIAALLDCTREWFRVLKPGGSAFVNLGDKYATRYSSMRGAGRAGLNSDDDTRGRSGQNRTGVPEKSLLLLPELYRVGCVYDLGLIARAVIVWDKPNGLPESVTDRVRRSHEDWVHLVRSPRYFSAVDEIREPHLSDVTPGRRHGGAAFGAIKNGGGDGSRHTDGHPLGKLPGSVWEIATQPLKVPAELGIDHFAAFPMEWPRRLVLGWSPREVCTACGEGRRPVVDRSGRSSVNNNPDGRVRSTIRGGRDEWAARMANPDRIIGYVCACPDTSAASTPGVVLDPFGGTGTTALVATMLGRRGISVDLSADYCRLAAWRASDPKQRARACKEAKRRPKPPVAELELVDLSAAPVAPADPVFVAIEQALSTADLADIVTGVPDEDWTPDYTAAVQARIAELEGAAA